MANKLVIGGTTRWELKALGSVKMVKNKEDGRTTPIPQRQERGGMMITLDKVPGLSMKMTQPLKLIAPSMKMTWFAKILYLVLLTIVAIHGVLTSKNIQMSALLVQ
jgi:hypothetical protein